MTDKDLDDGPGRPLMSDQAVCAACGTAIVLGLMVLAGFLAVVYPQALVGLATVVVLACFLITSAFVIG